MLEATDNTMPIRGVHYSVGSLRPTWNDTHGRIVLQAPAEKTNKNERFPPCFSICLDLFCALFSLYPSPGDPFFFSRAGFFVYSGWVTDVPVQRLFSSRKSLLPVGSGGEETTVAFCSTGMRGIGCQLLGPEISPARLQNYRMLLRYKTALSSSSSCRRRCWPAERRDARQGFIAVWR